MPRSNRHFLPACMAHHSHRCHRREFLLKFARDRRDYLQWLFQARKRFGMCILNHIVTSNHVHLLILDRGEGITSRSMQLVAGRTAQQYNRRKARQGAFWEDRYHATAIENDAHLQRCLVYIDLNMVRAGMVGHPQAWLHSGFNEIQNPLQRYRLIDFTALADLCGFSSTEALQQAHRQWVTSALVEDHAMRQAHWSESIAVVSARYVEGVKEKLGMMATHREVVQAEGSYALREPVVAYKDDSDPEIVRLSTTNGLYWDINVEASDG